MAGEGKWGIRWQDRGGFVPKEKINQPAPLLKFPLSEFPSQEAPFALGNREDGEDGEDGEPSLPATAHPPHAFRLSAPMDVEFPLAELESNNNHKI
jgi:hypothetical protein